MCCWILNRQNTFFTILMISSCYINFICVFIGAYLWSSPCSPFPGYLKSFIGWRNGRFYQIRRWILKKPRLLQFMNENNSRTWWKLPLPIIIVCLVKETSLVKGCPWIRNPNLELYKVSYALFYLKLLLLWNCITFYNWQCFFKLCLRLLWWWFRCV